MLGICFIMLLSIYIACLFTVSLDSIVMFGVLIALGLWAIAVAIRFRKGD